MISVDENVVSVFVLSELSMSMLVSAAYVLLLIILMALTSGVRVEFNERDEGDEGGLLE